MRARREVACEAGAEFRARVDAGADGGAALRELQQPRHDLPQPRAARVDLRAPAPQLLAERDRHGVHEMGATRLDQAVQFARATLENRAQMLERRQQLLREQQGSRHVNRGGHHVVAALPHVHVIVRVHGQPGVTAGQRRDHLVGIHVAAGARAGLKYVHRELVIVTAVRNGERRALNGVGQRGVEIPQFRVGARGSMLDESQRADEGARHFQAARREILNGALGLGAPQGGRRDVERAHAVVLDAIGCGSHCCFR